MNGLQFKWVTQWNKFLTLNNYYLWKCWTNQICVQTALEEEGAYWTSEHNHNLSHKNVFGERNLKKTCLWCTKIVPSRELNKFSLFDLMPPTVVAFKQQLKSSNWEIKDGVSHVWEGLKPVVVCMCILVFMCHSQPSRAAVVRRLPALTKLKADKATQFHNSTRSQAKLQLPEGS